MQASNAGKRFLRGLTSMSLLGVAGLAVAALSPGLMATFGMDGGEALAFSHPKAPAVAAQPVAGNATEAIVLANWEFTGNPIVTADINSASTDVRIGDYNSAYFAISQAANITGSAALAADALAMEKATTAAQANAILAKTKLDASPFE